MGIQPDSSCHFIPQPCHLQDEAGELLEDEHFGHPTQDVDPEMEQEAAKAAASKAATGGAKSKLHV